MKKAVIATTELSLKNVINKRFIAYICMQVCFFSALYPTAIRVNSVPPKMHTAGNCDNSIQGLCSMHILNIPVRVFCHLACKNGCLPESKNCNDLIFQSLNMQNILDMFEGKPNAKLWNNFYNASIDVMLKWHEDKLRKRICPSKLSEAFSQLTSTPKQISTHLEVWFQSLVIVL